MSQLADGTRLRQQGGILGRVGAGKVQGFDGDLALQLRVIRQVNHTLGSPTQFAPDFETSDLLQCHVGPLDVCRPF